MLQLRKRQQLTTKLRQLPRRDDGVADLAPVHVLLGQLVDVVVQVVVVDPRLAQVAQPREEVAPDLAPLRLVEVLVVECELDARLEGLVEGPYPVGGEDEDAWGRLVLVSLLSCEERGGRKKWCLPSQYSNTRKKTLKMLAQKQRVIRQGFIHLRRARFF